jgi:broad specificity phosphatase PhoE
MSTTIHFVRHGSTAGNERGIFMGALDLPLSPTGVQQARDLRSSIGQMGFEVVYSSPMIRACHTALIALGWADARVGNDDDSYVLTFRPSNLVESRSSIVIDHRLAERSFGDLQGEMRDGYTQRFPKYARRNVTMSFDDRADGGESFSDLESRVCGFIDDVRQRHAQQTVLVFSHNGPIRIARLLLLGLSRAEALEYSTPHCELVTLRA